MACMLVASAGLAAEGEKQLPAAAWQQLLLLPAIEVNAAKGDRTQAIVFFDPNCPVCANLWSRLYGDKSVYKSLSTRWVPVAYFSATSRAKAAAVLASGSAQLLAKNFNEFDFNGNHGGASAPAASAGMHARLRQGQRQWEQLGGATPLIVYQTKDGVVRSQMGLMPETKFAEMIDSLPEAHLAKFK
jgi:protein-disulfide isomerase